MSRLQVWGSPVQSDVSSLFPFALRARAHWVPLEPSASSSFVLLRLSSCLDLFPTSDQDHSGLTGIDELVPDGYLLQTMASAGTPPSGDCPSRTAPWGCEVAEPPAKTQERMRRSRPSSRVQPVARMLSEPPCDARHWWASRDKSIGEVSVRRASGSERPPAARSPWKLPESCLEKRLSRDELAVTHAAVKEESLPAARPFAARPVPSS